MRSTRLFVILLIVFVAAVAGAGGMAFSAARNFAASGSFLPFTNPNFASRSTASPDEPPLPEATVEVGPVGPQPRPWDGASRVTALVMGLDYRDWEAGEGAPRTDTMILLTIDPLSKTAGMLNIPRDLWVNIPGFDYDRINTAYRLGEVYNYPGGGPGLAIATVEEFLGVPIHFYAQIDFYAFEQFINELDGVTIDVPYEIRVDPLGPGNTVILEPGEQVLDGPLALAYARARYTDGGDFDRAQRQQQVIMALRSRILRVDRLPIVISRAPRIYQELASGINTNMDLDQAIQLAWLAQQIPLENIQRGVISPPDQVILAKSPDGTQDVLKPVTAKIRLLRDDIFTSGVLSETAQNSAPEELLAAEGAAVSVLNGSGAGGLAAQTQEYLNGLGANIVNVGDAGQFFNSSMVVDYTGNPYTVGYLVELMNIQPFQIRMEYSPQSEVDVVVYLGADWSNNNPMP
jgi:polyisoprenyl-teichoic acid--peptidoglycan teichoic acid transferase